MRILRTSAAALAIALLALTRGSSAGVGGNEIRKIKEAMPQRPTVRPDKPRKILVFSRCVGFKHSSIPFWVETLKIMAEKTRAFEVVASDDPAMFTAAKLRRFDAIVMNNTTGDPLPEGAPRKAFVEFVRNGGGLVGIHAATDCFYRWAEYGEMMGGYFNAHPWNEKVGVKLDDPSHPLLKAFGGRGFEVADEIYQFKDPYSREKLRVILSLDIEKTDMTKDSIKRKDKDFAVSWVRSYGKGRVFYCSLGHRHDICWNAPILQHYLDGIQFAVGDLECDTVPIGASPGAGFRPLFNGKDLSGWQARKRSWIVKDGTLIRRGSGNLFTEDQFDDFVLDFEFQLPAYAKSGVFLRATETKRSPGSSCVEVELSDANPRSRPSRHSTGGLYGLLAPKKMAIKPRGEWNRMTITCAGSKISVVLNGVKTVDANLNEWTRARRNPDNSFNSLSKPVKDLPRSGYIGFESRSGSVRLRNIQVKGGGTGGGDAMLREVDKFTGEYAGTLKRGARSSKVKTLVFPEGGGNYKVVVAPVVGNRFELRGRAQGDVLRISGSGEGGTYSGELKGEALLAKSGGAQLACSYAPRRSATLGAAPPPGSTILLPISEGTAKLDAWTNKNWKALEAGVMEVGKGDQRTRQQFGSCKIHLEFMTPYMPDARGQSRGNSGVYIQDRYEVQVLDSFGLVSKDNDCSGIYKTAVPKENACQPPLVWQTYDITFTRPLRGKPARITVVQNGVTVHDNVEIPRPTGGAAGQNAVAKAPLRLQDHGNPVRYRNVWVLEVRD